jgi:hypothetical protein
MRLQTLTAVLALCAIVGCGPTDTVPGPPGPQGPMGPPGPPGPSSVLSARTVCFADQPFGNVFISAAYRRYNLSDGSAMITCYIYHNGEPQPAQSVTLWYSPTDPEITDGMCAVSYDIDTSGGAGAFEFIVPSTSTTGRQVTYRDASNPYDGTQTQLTCFEG